ncbi:hypothetical protein EG327_006844 [Venturia inaequalis]|uniref:Putative lipoate-protein ligase A n=1 Tax=Venturia inaequalis TaxID=5025 RepID=A0A8H3V0K7_VENIN|nr:hypothetical protein EG327_006844 [Venturia inaequalis]
MPLFIARNASTCLPRRLIHLSSRPPKAPPPSLPWPEFPARVSDPSNKVQIYTSAFNDPFLNLSIEHYLFQKTPPGSKVLFLYKNSNCIVIGRNQNPWLETNLNLVAGFAPTTAHGNKHLNSVPLIRRRSGGGTVFHDLGNVNWSVICDLNDFTRDKHAEMVVRALRTLGVNRARVNERHDIVLDQGIEESQVDPDDTHITPFTNAPAKTAPLKVSGSAYKLARNRALHHGTALLQSPNLDKIPLYLRSPLKPFISAKGVESVSSPVGNIGIPPPQFQHIVRQQFKQMYGGSSITRLAYTGSGSGHPLAIPDLHHGVEEMKSNDWKFLQTPQFDISSQPFDDQGSPGTPLKISLNVKHGLIQSVDLGAARVEQASAIAKLLESQELRRAQFGKLMRGQDLDEEVAFLAGLIPIGSRP